MNSTLFSEVLFRRLQFLLKHPDEINENWIEHLPPEFDLMCLATDFKEKELKPLELEKLLDFDIPEDNIEKITKARHAVIAALKIYSNEIEWDGEEESSQEEEPAEEEDQKDSKVKSSSEKKSASLGKEMTGKMKEYAEMYRRAFSDKEGESLKEALVRSFNQAEGLGDWKRKMKKALEKSAKPGFQINDADFYQYKKHKSIKAMISKSESGL
ncbi:MAG: hypothetical protein U5L76_04130 [Patescibacteria group bacterium]|nr:hypothetical protein [Patescibacteria group bacterium]